MGGRSTHFEIRPSKKNPVILNPGIIRVTMYKTIEPDIHLNKPNVTKFKGRSKEVKWISVRRRQQRRGSRMKIKSRDLIGTFGLILMGILTVFYWETGVNILGHIFFLLSILLIGMLTSYIQKEQNKKGTQDNKEGCGKLLEKYHYDGTLNCGDFAGTILCNKCKIKRD